MCVTVVQWSRSCLHLQINRVRLPATLFSVSLYGFFFCLVSFEHYFSFWPFFLLFLLLTLLVHVLRSIYILSVNPEFILEKGFQKLLICILANLMHLSMSCRRGGGGGGGRGMGWGFDCLCWRWGRAFDCPRGGDI